MFGSGIRRICAVLAAETASELRKGVRLAEREAGTVELRLDWLKNDEERKKFLNWLHKNRSSGTTFIATCRRKAGGGEFTGTVGAELEWLRKAREAGCQWCDVEVETLRQLPGRSVLGLSLPEKVLLSVHNFRETPRFARKMSVPAASGVAAIKFAAMAKSVTDSVRLLKLAKRSHRIVPVPMGEMGLPGRILALRQGSPLAYAPLAVATAPGQVSLEKLKSLYRADRLTRNTEVYGVIGNPISHSLSPLLHNTGYVAAEKDAVFLPFLVEKLPDFLRAIPEFAVRGFSVTLPHKESVFRKLDACEPLAEKIGAVNTVAVSRQGSLYGSNTDYLGVLRTLEKKITLAGRTVLIVGAGGAARAAAFATASAGASVVICARRETAAKGLAKAVNGEVVKRANLRTRNFDVIVNATPLGMRPNVEISPLTASELNCSIVFDLIYRPMRTRLLEIAAAKGLETISGVEMFLAQGIAQWEGWMKEKAPEKEMRSVVLGALRSKE